MLDLRRALHVVQLVRLSRVRHLGLLELRIQPIYLLQVLFVFEVVHW